jgi:hypothetical protein
MNSNLEAKVHFNSVVNILNNLSKEKTSADDDEKPQWEALPKEGGRSVGGESYDHVIITIPVPQVLQMRGDIEDLIAPYKESLQKVQYRYVFYFESNTHIHTCI